MATKNSTVIVGIDASNLIDGGGRTHLIELLSQADPLQYGVTQVLVWGRLLTLELLPERPWLTKRPIPALERGPALRAFWQRSDLAKLAQAQGIDLLFAPGGSVGAGFKPVVTMSRNMLPFEWREMRRYGVSKTGLRLLILRQVQGRSFRRADGVIFLTEYARKAVQAVTGPLAGRTITIPHGISPRFFEVPRPQRSSSMVPDSRPLRLVYVSITDLYKHQWHLVEAVHRLRTMGYTLELDLVGPAYSPGQKRLLNTINKFDPLRAWVHEHGPIPYQDLHNLYLQADIGVFASSCENMPNILLETMAAGLPIACSNRGPMPEILSETGLYFDPENPADIATCLKRLLDDVELRAHLAVASYQKARQYSWSRCANATFAFLADVARAARY